MQQDLCGHSHVGICDAMNPERIDGTSLLQYLENVSFTGRDHFAFEGQLEIFIVNALIELIVIVKYNFFYLLKMQGQVVCSLPFTVMTKLESKWTVHPDIA